MIDNTDPNSVALTGLCPDIGDSVGLNCTDAPGPDPVFSNFAANGVETGGETCTNCLIADADDPLFVAGDFNGNRQSTDFNPEVKTAIEAPPALDEGGNFIRLRYGPLTQTRDYHIQPTSPAVDAGAMIPILDDFDHEPRPAINGFDIGADEVQP